MTAGGVRRTFEYDVDFEVDGRRRTRRVRATCGMHARRIVIKGAREDNARVLVIHSHKEVSRE